MGYYIVFPQTTENKRPARRVIPKYQKQYTNYDDAVSRARELAKSSPTEVFTVFEAKVELTSEPNIVEREPTYDKKVDLEDDDEEI